MANDFRGALVRAELLEVDPASGQRLNYRAVAEQLEAVRAKYQSDQIDVHIIGFAKAVGDITDGARGVLAFFAIAFVITAVLLYALQGLADAHRSCARLRDDAGALAAGMLPLLGYGIDPLSILVPFLIFSIGVSHAVQMTNVWKQEIASWVTTAGPPRCNAFLKLFIPGTVALLTNALGFLVIMHIKIDIVRELGITASLGVALMILTNKMLLPILLSYLPAPPPPAQPAVGRVDRVWRAVSAFAEPRVALVTLLVAARPARPSAAGRRATSRSATSARASRSCTTESRYNRDNAAIVDKFAIGVDVLSVIVQTKDVAGRLHQLRDHGHHRPLRAVHAQRPRRAVGDGAAGRGQDGERRAGTRATSSGARCRATRKCWRSR